MNKDFILNDLKFDYKISEIEKVNEKYYNRLSRKCEKYHLLLIQQFSGKAAILDSEVKRSCNFLFLWRSRSDFTNLAQGVN